MRWSFSKYLQHSFKRHVSTWEFTKFQNPRAKRRVSLMLPNAKQGPNCRSKTGNLSSVPEFPVQLMGNRSVVYSKTEKAINQLCFNNDGTSSCSRHRIQWQERGLLRLIPLPNGSKTAAWEKLGFSFSILLCNTVFLKNILRNKKNCSCTENPLSF